MSLIGREVKWSRNFGPYIVKSIISDELHGILLKSANKIRKDKKLMKENDYRKRLAGNIKEEYSYNNAFTKKEDQIVEEEFLWLASMFTKMSEESYGSKDFVREPNQLLMQKPVWVNFMKPGEWNPSHAHAGDISCVTYLKVPPEIEKENTIAEHTKKSNNPTAGKIEFRYGDDIGYHKIGFTVTPKEKDIYLFPAKLQHLVYPFKSDVERVSVSVNFADRVKAALNMGMKP